MNSFTTRNLLPVERLGSAAGGEYEIVDSFFLSAVDEVGGGMPGEWAPGAVPKFAPQRISTIHSLRPQVRYCSRKWMPNPSLGDARGTREIREAYPLVHVFFPKWPQKA